jgi:Uma2 family endonuclease
MTTTDRPRALKAAMPIPVTGERPRYQFTVEQWIAMNEAAIVREHERLELIRGEVIRMTAIGEQHMGAVNQLCEILVLGLRQRARVSIQNPIRLRDSLPEPDVVIIRREVSPHHIPSPAEIHLVIEVADTTLDYDLNTKAQLYAESGIPDYWVADVLHQQVWAHGDPSPNGYRSLRTYQAGERVVTPGFSDLEIAVDDIFDLWPKRRAGRNKRQP